MLHSGKNFRALSDKKKINILTLVLSEKKILNETINHKTALNTHLSYIPPMLMLKNYRPRWTQCDDNTLRDPLGLVMVR